MALIKCPECGKEISDQADACIYCGYPLRKKPETAVVSEKKPLQSHVIGFRTGVGAPTLLYGIYLFLDAILTPLTILGLVNLPELWPYFTLLLALYAFLLGICLFGLIRVAINKNNHKNCIEYDAADQKFVLYTVYGREIRINPRDYVELKDNFFTDNMLKFTYRLPSGETKKVNLGPCADRDGLRSRIKNVIDNFDK